MIPMRSPASFVSRKARRVASALCAALVVTSVVFVPAARSQGAPPDYKNPRLPVERRVADLLSRMTLEEKVAQLVCLWAERPETGPNQGFSTNRGDFSPTAAAVSMKNGIGQIARQRERKDPREAARFANALQKWLVEKTRLGIPAIFHDEILHGLMAQKATSFPTPIALASSWDTELVTKVFTAAALETRARGSHFVLGPNLDLAREPRWGRTEETYGEDPYLVSRMGVAVIKAIQGPGPGVDDAHVIAVAKHFAAHGQPEGGTNIAPVNVSERVLREYFLPSFEAAVKEAGVLSVMASYNEIDGVPSHANRWLLDKVLRQEWGFDGLIVSDYYGIPQLESLHKVANDKAEAARFAIEAGVDAEVPDPDCFQTLVQLVRDGKVSEAIVAREVARNLRAKFLLGLFENPYVDAERAARVTDSAEHRQLAADAARRSITLLKNEGNLLPLDRTRLRNVAVIGPNADRAHLGGYSDPNPAPGVGVLQGVTT